MKKKLFLLFPAFESKNYQLYFVSQLISLIGTWLQIIAQSWLVLQITHSAFMVGVVSALGFLPVLMFTLFGGVIIDRFRKKDILIFTNTTSMLLALALGVLAALNLANVFSIAVLAFLLGTVNALDVPTRQAFTIEMVGRESLPSAIALNMGIYNSSRVIGPAIAGWLISLFGNSGAFILNGLSFIPAVGALVLMHVQSDIPNTHTHPLLAIKEGLSYTFQHQLIRTLIIFTVMMSIFGFSIQTIYPVIAQQTFQLDASGLGLIYAAVGLGALLATFIMSGLKSKFSELTIIKYGTLLYILSIIPFALTHNLSVALISLFVQGIATTLPFGMLSSTIQHHIEDNVRGRVSSIYTLAFLGMQPIGSFEIGYLAENLGNGNSMLFDTFIVFLALIYLWFGLGKTEEPAKTVS